MDRWDALGIASAGMLGAGLWVLAGPPWVAVLYGAGGLALYCARERALARARRRAAEEGRG